MLELKAVMFTDQVQSTLHTARRTHREITQVSETQDRLTHTVVHQCAGTIVKDTGDGVFIAFRSCADAVRCGALLQQHVQAWNATQSQASLRFALHTGIDLGELLVLPNGDLRGNAANRAARVCAECPPGDVYFTEKVKTELHTREADVVLVDAFRLKGVTEKIKIYRLVQWLDALEETSNPFVWRAGITTAEGFFDREAEQRTLRTYIRGRQNCQIVGPRRIGKTSFLRHLERVAPTWAETIVVAYLDLHDARCAALSGWLTRVGRQWGWTTTPTTLIEFTEGIEHMLTTGYQPVLCLDEFQELVSRRAEFSRDFFATLRSCGQQGLSVITTSQKPLSELTEPGDPTSPFYNTFPLLRLGPFTAADAADFVTLRRPGVLPFTPEEQTTIVDFAKGHPLALQIICFHVVEAKTNGDRLPAALRKAADDMQAHLPAG
jgi:class 3 adenylate cyclase